MRMKLQVESCRLKVLRTGLRTRIVGTFNSQLSTFNGCRAFTLVEVLVSLSILAVLLVLWFTRERVNVGTTSRKAA